MARTDTLGHFLTDVADAIRTKSGSVNAIPASQFDTEIENLPSGGGASDFETAINSFNNYLNNVLNNYTPYTNQALTIYSKSSQCPYYMIQKRVNGKYRIVWHCLPYIKLATTTHQDFTYPVIKYPTSSEYVVKTVDNIDFSVNLPLPIPADDRIGFYSNEFNTLELLITAIQNSTGSGITYTSFTDNNQYTGVLDNEWQTPITNAVTFESDGKTIVTSGKTLSHNTTILFLE